MSFGWRKPGIIGHRIRILFVNTGIGPDRIDQRVTLQISPGGLFGFLQRKLIGIFLFLEIGIERDLLEEGERVLEFIFRNVNEADAILGEIAFINQPGSRHRQEELKRHIVLALVEIMLAEQEPHP